LNFDDKSVKRAEDADPIVVPVACVEPLARAKQEKRQHKQRERTYKVARLLVTQNGVGDLDMRRTGRKRDGYEAVVAMQAFGDE